MALAIVTRTIAATINAHSVQNMHLNVKSKRKDVRANVTPQFMWEVHASIDMLLAATQTHTLLIVVCCMHGCTVTCYSYVVLKGIHSAVLSTTLSSIAASSVT